MAAPRRLLNLSCGALIVSVAAAVWAPSVDLEIQTAAAAPAPRIGATVDCEGPSGPAPAPSGGGGYTGLAAPQRLADTRVATLTPQVAASCWLRVPIPASVPDTASAVAITVTSDRVAAPGFFTVHGCATQLPAFSTLNVSTAGPNSNFAVVDIDTSRQICVFTSTGTDIIVDLVGYFGAGGAPFSEVAQARVLDTRAQGAPGVIPPPQIAEGREVRLNRADLGVSGDTSAVLVNITVTRADQPGYLVAYPCGDAVPPSSNVNFAAGEDRANTSVVALGATNGEMCLRLGDAAADIIVDIAGRFGGSAGLDYRVGMSRLVDSRDPVGDFSGRFSAGETRVVDPGATGRLPSGAQVAVLGVVATRATAPGFLQVRPCGSDAEVSSVNYDAGQDRAITNIVVVPMTDDREVCVTASAPTDVVVDLYGGFGVEGVLRSLSVTGPADAEMFPAFHPEAPDYGVVCASPTANEMAVTARAVPGDELRIAGTDTWARRLDTTVVRDAGDAVVIEARADDDPASVSEVWIRCLPPDFPEVEVRESSPARVPGWYLANVDVADHNYAVILDHFGAPVWYLDGGPEGYRLRGLQLLANGDLAWFPARGFAFGIDPTAEFERVLLDGTLVNTYGIPDARPESDTEEGIWATNHHELLELPNGNLLVTSMPISGVLDPDTAPACTDPNGVARTATRVAGARIVELEPDGDPTGWEWNADVLGDDGTPRIPLDENTLPLCFIRTVPGEDPEFIMGALHPNALAWRPAASGTGGQVLMSARHADAIYAIDYDTREIVWKLGGTNRRGVSLSITGTAPTAPARQHDVRVLPDGNVTVFDNRTQFGFETNGTTTGPARYVEYRIAGRLAEVVRVVERANGDHSGALGSARLQPDGGVVLGWGAVPGPLFTEVDADGTTMLEMIFSVARSNPSPPPVVPSYRVIKEPVEAFDRDELRRTAGAVREAPALRISESGASVGAAAVLSEGDDEY